MKELLSSLANEQWAALGSIVSAASSVVTLLIAYLGLRSWRDQLSANLRHDVGRKYRVLLFRWRDAFKASIRDIALKKYELIGWRQGTKKEMHDPEYIEHVRKTYVDLWKEHMDSFEKITRAIESERYEVESIWGRGVVTAQSDLIDLFHEFSIGYSRMVSTFYEENQQIEQLVEAFLKPYLQYIGKLNVDFVRTLDAATEKASSITDRRIRH